MPRISHNRIRSSIFPILVLALIVLLLSPSARAAGITEYLLPPGQSGLPQGVAFESGYSLQQYVWFTEFGSYDKIGRLDAGTSSILEFKLLTGSRPWDLVRQLPDGGGGNHHETWFSEAGRDKIGRIMYTAPPVETFTLTEWSISPGANPRGIDVEVSYPWPILWFTEFGRSAIGKLDLTTPSTTLTEWSLPDSNAHPLDLLYLPSSGVWFTEYDGNRIGFFNGAILKEWPLITGSYPYKLSNDTFGNIWFAESGRNRIAKLNPYTNEISEYLIPTSNSQPYGIWVDSHNNVWFTEHATNKIGKFMAGSNIFVEYTRPAGNSPWDIRAATNGKIWFSDDGGSRIGRFDANVATTSVTVSTISTVSPILSTATTVGSSTMTSSYAHTDLMVSETVSLISTSEASVPYATSATTTSTTSYSASETSQIRKTSSLAVITSYIQQTAPTTFTSTSYGETTSGTTYVTAIATTTLGSTTKTTVTSASTSYVGTTTSTQTATATATVTSSSFTLGIGTSIGGAIPGFPVESIIAGIGAAVVCLMIMRRVRVRSRGGK